MQKRGLGKGLGALIPEVGPVEREQIREIPPEQIRPNPKQPRKQFDEAKLAELAASIREHGIVQPVVVRPLGPDTFELVAGERRWRAAQMAGLPKLPAVVRDFTPAQVMEIALIENLQREDLNPVEEAEAYRLLLEEFGLTQEELARRLGKSRPQISNTLRLLQLPETVRGDLASGRVSMGHAKVLLGIEDPVQMEALAQRVVTENLSVRELEAALEQLQVARPAKGGRPKKQNTRDPQLLALEARLRERFGTPVKVLPGSPRGKLEIYFYGEEDLARIYDLLCGKDEALQPLRPPKERFTI